MEHQEYTWIHFKDEKIRETIERETKHFKQRLEIAKNRVAGLEEVTRERQAERQWPKTETSLTQYVLVPHEDGLVNLSLSEPTGLLGGKENFNGHFFSPPSAHPHLSVPPLAYLLHHLDLLGYRSLHLRRRSKRQKRG